MGDYGIWIRMEGGKVEKQSNQNTTTMKKVLLVIALMLMSCQAVYAVEYETGNRFVNQWQEYKNPDAERPSSSFAAGIYIGYVSGIADAGQIIGWFSYPNGTTNGQLCAVVGKWIDDHPERWTDSPLVIVTTALRKAFPLQKRR